MPPRKTKKAIEPVAKPVEAELLDLRGFPAPAFQDLLVGNANAVDRAFKSMLAGLDHDMTHSDPAIRAQARAFFLDRVLATSSPSSAQPQAGGKTVHELMMRRVSGG